MASPSNQMESHSRRIVKINVDKKLYEEETLSANDYISDKIVLKQLLVDITPLFVEIVVLILEYYDSFSIVALSISQQEYLSTDAINAISQNLSIIGSKHKDYRENTTSGWSYQEQKTKILDIIDPSLFVHDISTDTALQKSDSQILECGTYVDVINSKCYQWIPADVTVSDTYQCRITSTINRFIRDDNDKHNTLLFGHYEQIIQYMLPHFEDVIGYALCGKQLQIVLKAIQYDKEGGAYATVWHREGTQEEHIVAVGIFCTEADHGTLLQFTPDLAIVPESAAVHFDPYAFFAVDTSRGSLLVFNNELQHRLGMLQGSSRQVMVCMLVDPKRRILSFDEYKTDPLKIDIDHAKKRRKMVKAARSERIASERHIPYCYDCGAYGHFGTMQENFLPTPHRVTE